VAEIVARTPTLEDLHTMAATIRPDDLRELQASSCVSVTRCLYRSLSRSPHRLAVDVDGKLAMLGGLTVHSLVGGVASPWLLGTTELDKAHGALTRLGMRYRDIALSLYPELVNYVDVRNRKAIRWIKRLGFTVHPDPIPYGPYRMHFLKFEIRATDV
jgi:hypothetical protein